MTPEPSHNIHNWCRTRPPAEMTSPPHQQNAATTPALRGPARSSHPPQMAALEPRNTKNSVYIQPRIGLSQSQVVVNSIEIQLMSAGQSMDLLTPSDLVRGIQKTEKP